VVRVEVDRYEIALQLAVTNNEPSRPFLSDSVTVFVNVDLTTEIWRIVKLRERPS
jgi:hypothetical protein